MAEQAPGILFIYFAEAVLITLLGSIVLLRWYRRAVRRGMQARPAVVAATSAQPGHGLTAASAAVPARVGSGPTGLRLRLIAVYGVAGGLAAGEPPNGLRTFVTWYVYCWPLVPSYMALLALPRRSSIGLLVGYVVFGAAIVLAWSLGSLLIAPARPSAPAGNVLSFLAFLALEATMPLLVVAAVSCRPLGLGISPRRSARVQLQQSCGQPSVRAEPRLSGAQLGGAVARCRDVSGCLVHAGRPANRVRVLASPRVAQSCP